MAHNFRTKEETARHNRRLRRQALGVVLTLLILVGLVNVLSGGAKGIAALFDDTKQKEAFASRLSTLVMLDPLPFGTLDQADPVVIKSAMLWSAVATARQNGTLDLYERDPDDLSLYLPAKDMDAAAVALFGPDYKLNHETYYDGDLHFVYYPEKQAYKIPVTGQSGLYSPTVTALKKQHGVLRVTVGYVPLYSTDEFGLSTTTEPTKYMDYLFVKKDGEYYLAGMEESATKPQSTPTPSPSPPAGVGDNPQQQLEQQTAGSNSADSAASQPDGGASQPGEGE